MLDCQIRDKTSVILPARNYFHFFSGSRKAKWPLAILKYQIFTF